MYFRISLPRNAHIVSRLRWKPRTVPCKTGRRDRRRDKTGNLLEKSPSHNPLCTCCMPTCSDVWVATLATNPIEWSKLQRQFCLRSKSWESDQKEDVKSFAQICTWPVCTLIFYESNCLEQLWCSAFRNKTALFFKGPVSTENQKQYQYIRIIEQRRQQSNYNFNIL